MAGVFGRPEPCGAGPDYFSADVDPDDHRCSICGSDGTDDGLLCFGGYGNVILCCARCVIDRSGAMLAEAITVLMERNPDQYRDVERAYQDAVSKATIDFWKRIVFQGLEIPDVALGQDERLVKPDGVCSAHQVIDQKRIKELRKMPYQEYLATAEWRKRRRKMVNLFDGRCQLCNEGGVLNVHHRTYERLGCELDADLIVLCRKCHGIYHKTKKLSTDAAANRFAQLNRVLQAEKQISRRGVLRKIKCSEQDLEIKLSVLESQGKIVRIKVRDDDDGPQEVIQWVDAVSPRENKNGDTRRGAVDRIECSQEGAIVPQPASSEDVWSRVVAHIHDTNLFLHGQVSQSRLAQFDGHQAVVAPTSVLAGNIIKERIEILRSAFQHVTGNRPEITIQEPVESANDCGV